MTLPQLTESQERFVQACLNHHGNIPAAAASLKLSIPATLSLAAQPAVRACFDAIAEMLEATKRFRDLLSFDRVTSSLMKSLDSTQNDSLKVRIANTILRLTDPRRLNALRPLENIQPDARTAPRTATQTATQTATPPHAKVAAAGPAPAGDTSAQPDTRPLVPGPSPADLRTPPPRKSAAASLLAATGAPGARAA